MSSVTYEVIILNIGQGQPSLETKLNNISSLGLDIVSVIYRERDIVQSHETRKHYEIVCRKPINHSDG